MTTPDRRILPAAQAVLVDRAGRATPPFYDLLRRIVDTTALTPELVDEVKQILEQIENLPTEGFMPITSRVVGQDSIEWQGLLANGLTTLRLYGDTSDQRATWYYGTNDANEKGWYRFYDALATGAGILKRNSGYVELGEVDDPSDLPGTGNIGEAYWVRGEGDIEERGLWVWDADAGEWALDTEASGIVGFEIAEDDYGDITVSDVGATWTINENAVTDEKLRNSAALSVIGRASDSTGDPADITASADKAVLHRDDDALAFSPIDHSYISDFDEAAQDAVGGILANSADIEFTYDDAENEITAVLSAAVHSSLALADTAIQPGDLAAVAFSGEASDVSYDPTGTSLVSVDVQSAITELDDDVTTVLGLIPEGANPSASVGLSAINGSADTFMRSDAAPALDQAISPTWTGTHEFTGVPVYIGMTAEQVAAISEFDLGNNIAFLGSGNWTCYRGFAGRSGATITFNRSRGSVASPEALQNNDVVLRFLARAYRTSGGEGFNAGGDFLFQCTEAPTSTARGMRFVINLVPNGGTTLTEALSLRADSMKIPVVAGDPSTLTDGMIWYNSSTGKFRGRAGGSSIDLH